jgi:hypothetical protein
MDLARIIWPMCVPMPPQAPRLLLCMSICMFATCMNLPEQAGINEEQVSASQPLVRALAVARYEKLWRACEPHILLTQDDLDLGRKPDPRFIEAGIRVTDRLVNLYGLLKPQHSMSEPDAVSRQDQRELVANKLAELEAKIRDSS